MKASFIPTIRSRFLPSLIVGLGIIMGCHFLAACDSPTSAPETDPNAQIVLLSPVGGERYKVGETVHVKWKTQGKGDEEISSANILVSPDSGKTWIGLLRGSIGVDDPLWGDYAWTVKREMVHLGVTWDLSGNTRVMLKVMQYSTADANKIAVTKKPLSIDAI
jgi:hypothetical protein